jgi:hypothetical protein
MMVLDFMEEVHSHSTFVSIHEESKMPQENSLVSLMMLDFIEQVEEGNTQDPDYKLTTQELKHKLLNSEGGESAPQWHQREYQCLQDKNCMSDLFLEPLTLCCRPTPRSHNMHLLQLQKSSRQQQFDGNMTSAIITL